MRIVSTARHQAIPAFPARISQLPFPAVSLLFCLLLIFRQDLSAQVIAPPMGSAIQVLNTGAPRVSLRGLSVVDDKVVWVSGNSGAVGRSTDAEQPGPGSSFQVMRKGISVISKLSMA